MLSNISFNTLLLILVGSEPVTLEDDPFFGYIRKGP